MKKQMTRWQRIKADFAFEYGGECEGRFYDSRPRIAAWMFVPVYAWYTVRAWYRDKIGLRIGIWLCEKFDHRWEIGEHGRRVDAVCTRCEATHTSWF